MTIRLLERFIKESLGREIFADPQMFANRDSAALIQKQLTPIDKGSIVLYIEHL